LSWFLALVYVAAGTSMAWGVLLRTDPRVASMLGPTSSPRLPAQRSILIAIGRRIRVPALRRQLLERSASVGLPATDVDRLVGAKCVLAVAGALAGITFRTSTPAEAATLAAILAIAGFRLPDFRLARRAAALRARTEAEVPDLLDLMAVSATAGLTPRLALERAPEVLSGPLADELARARREVELGGSWRDALGDVAGRTGNRELRRLAITIDRTGRLGAPVVERFRDLAREVRAERRARAEERARRAPVTMLFPLVFLILPAFVLAAVVPAVLVATRAVH
jgi:tight adherence protein C